MNHALRTHCIALTLAPAVSAVADVLPPRPQQPAAPQTAPPTSNEYALVVFSGAPDETVLIEQNGDRQTALGRINGIAALVDGVLWRHDPRQTLALVADCPMVDDIMNPPSFFRKLTSMRLEVIDAPRFVSEDGTVAFGPDVLAGPLSEAVDFGESNGELVIYGIANDVVFARECISEYMCGAAHGGTACRFVAYDLRRRAERPLTDFIAPEGSADAIDTVRAAPSVEMRDCAIQPDDPSTWRVEAVRPVYTEGDALLYALVTVDSAYACSTGCWSSYRTCAWERVGDWDFAPLRLSIPLQGDDVAIGVTRWSATDPASAELLRRVEAFFEAANRP